MSMSALPRKRTLPDGVRFLVHDRDAKAPPEYERSLAIAKGILGLRLWLRSIVVRAITPLGHELVELGPVLGKA